MRLTGAVDPLRMHYTFAAQVERILTLGGHRREAAALRLQSRKFPSDTGFLDPVATTLRSYKRTS